MKFKELNLLDIGNTMELSGVVYKGNEEIIIFFPDYKYDPEEPEPRYLYANLEEWQQIIRQSDLKEVELVGEDKLKKIILRKSTRQIETSVMWEVYRRDNYTCRYCGNDKVPMTVDHVVLWEEGGPSIVRNLICSCKKCNNARGNMQYEDWLVSPEYISRSVKLTGKELERNYGAATFIVETREKHMRVHKRNR
jgi:hypothetical protein